MKTKKCLGKIVFLAAVLLCGLFFFQTGIIRAQQAPGAMPPTFDLEKAKSGIQNNPTLSDEQKKAMLTQLQNSQTQGASQGAPGTTDCFSFYRFGSVKVDLIAKSPTYFAGKKAEFTATVTNENDYPIVEGNLWGQILRDNPNGGAKNGNHLIDQFLAVDNLNLAPKESKTLNFSYDLTENLPAGKYFLAAFFTTSQSYEISGLTFVNNIYAGLVSFDLISPEQKAVYLDRNNVRINSEVFEGRSPIKELKEGSTAKVDFSLVNEKSSPEQVRLTYALYTWDTLQDKNITATSSDTVSVGANSFRDLQYVIPKIQPGTKQLRITAQYEGGQSMLEIRLTTDNVKSGRVNFAALDKFPLAKGDQGKILACFHNAGDGIGEGGEVILTLKDDKGNMVAQKDFKGFISGDVSGLEQGFQANSGYDYLILTATVKNKEGKVVGETSTVYNGRQGNAGLSSATSGWKKAAVGVAVAIILLIVFILVFIMIKKMRNKALILIFGLAVGTIFLFGPAKASQAAGACGPSYSFSVSGYGYVGWYTHFGFSGTVNMDPNCLYKKSDGTCVKNGDTLNIGDVISFADPSGEWNGWGRGWGTPPFSKKWDVIGSNDAACCQSIDPCADSGEGSCPYCDTNDSDYGRAFILDRAVNIQADNAGLVNISGEAVTAAQPGTVTLTTTPTFNVRNQTFESIYSDGICGAGNVPNSMCVVTGGGMGGDVQKQCFDPADPPHSGAYSAVGPAGYVSRISNGSGQYQLTTVDRTVDYCPTSLKVKIAGPAVCPACTLSANPADIGTGDISYLQSTCSDGATMPSWTWSNSNLGVGSLWVSATNQNALTGLSAGSTTVTAKASNGTSCSAPITVNAIPPKCPALNISASSNSIKINEPITFTASCSDGDDINKYLPINWVANQNAKVNDAALSASTAWQVTTNGASVGTGIAVRGTASGGRTGISPPFDISCNVSDPCATVDDICVDKKPTSCSGLSPSACVTGSTCSNFNISGNTITWSCDACGTPKACPSKAITPAKPGKCGPANGLSVCDSSAPDLCQPGVTPSISYPNWDSSYDVTWTCPGTCDGASSPTCSAHGRKSCGWVETNP